MGNSNKTNKIQPLRDLTKPGFFSVYVPLTSAFTMANVISVQDTSATLTIPLAEGSGVVSTPPMVIGVLYAKDGSCRKLQASLTVWYNYMAEPNALTFCNAEDYFADSTYLTTVLEGTGEICKEYTHDADRNAFRNLNWNHNSMRYPGLQQALRTTVRAAHAMLMRKAFENGHIVITRSPNSGASCDEKGDAQVLYRNDCFVGLYDPSVPLGAGDHVVSYKSVLKGTTTLTGNFANVMGSTSDPKIALWRSQFPGNPGDLTCASQGYNGFKDGGVMVGGHVLIGKKAGPVTHGANGVVFIIPICTNHNNNDNVFMWPTTNGKAVVLDKYHQSAQQGQSPPRG